MLRGMKISQNFFFFSFILCFSFLLGIPGALHANDSQEEKAASHYVDFLKVFSKSDPHYFYELMLGTSCPEQGVVIYRFGVPGAYEYV